MHVILASASPRRRDLLEMLNVGELTVVPAPFEPEVRYGDPSEAVRTVASSKARQVAEICGRQNVIIAADTIVFLDGRILGKPADEDDARRMLMSLSGTKHTVYTGVTVIKEEIEISTVTKTDVYFRNLTAGEIDGYIVTREPMDKAGAYGAQGLGALFIKRIDGDFFNVMGLPVETLGSMLRDVGIRLL